MRTTVTAALGMLTVFGLLGPSAHAWHRTREVSKHQYEILLSQCQYAHTSAARAECRAQVKKNYRIGKKDPTLDCRTYVGVTVCGELKLSSSQRECVRDSVEKGLTYRRSEVECYVFT
ncbi:hypothetical protein ABZ297_45270 [Nonomuraea sp. NPDC005983]|uniref:hypothetical protein n=1 Tax=Nonomuraea sp. NPDC005983 TaxID=3155595 RepID=UPI0033BA05F9